MRDFTRTAPSEKNLLSQACLVITAVRFSSPPATTRRDELLAEEAVTMEMTNKCTDLAVACIYQIIVTNQM
jgi:hypothetical protein